MRAQAQQSPFAITSVGASPAWLHVVPAACSPQLPRTPREFHILGMTLEGRTFRPSDWAERLAGAMSSFRPGGVQGGIGAHIGYSPLCVPHVVNGIRCVIVSDALRDVEPMAWDFVTNFARDNGLTMTESGLRPGIEAPDIAQ